MSQSTGPRDATHGHPSNSAKSSEDDAPIQTPHTLRLLKLIQQGTLEHAQQATHILVHQVAPTLSLTQLWDLIGRLAECCIFHTEWKSRVNASIGIQGIMMLAAVAPRATANNGTIEDPFEMLDPEATKYLTVDAVLESMDQIIAQGKRLYATDDGFDASSDSFEQELVQLDDRRTNSSQETGIDGSDDFAQERVLLQLEIVQRRLGLAGLSHVGIDTTAVIADVVSSQDLLPVKEPVRKRKRLANHTGIIVPKLRVLLVLEMEERLRRRSDDTVAENVKSSCSYPRILFASEIVYRMLDPKWERRHGAILACLGLVRAWYRQSDAGTIDHKRMFGDWLQHVLSRCLCIMALDRFGDFGSDGVIAPVKEPAGQLLSILFAMAPRHVQESTVSALFVLAQHSLDWEVRYGALVAFKYIVALLFRNQGNQEQRVGCKGNAAHDSLDRNQLTQTLDLWYVNIIERIARRAIAALQDESDDVKSISSQILVEYPKHFWMKQTILCSAVRTLWATLQQISLFKPSTPDLVTLLSSLVEFDCDALLSLMGSNEKGGKKESLVDLSHFVLRLFDAEFLSVRLSGIRCIRPLAISVSNLMLDEPINPANVGIYMHIADRIFQTYFELEADPAIGLETQLGPTFLQLRDEVWECLSKGSAALVQNPSALFDIELKLVLRLFGVNSSRTRTKESWFDETLSAAKAVSLFVRHAVGRGASLSRLLLLSLATFLQSPWHCQCEAAYLLVTALCVSLSPDIIPNDLLAKIHHSLTFSADRPVCLRFVGHTHSSALLSQPAVIKICDGAFMKGVHMLHEGIGGTDIALISRSITEVWAEAMFACVGLRASQSAAASAVSLRLDATIAGSIIAASLPAKLTPIIRALVTSVKNESSIIEESKTKRLSAIFPDDSPGESLSLRSQCTCSYLKSLILVIDDHQIHDGAKAKAFGTLVDLAVSGNVMAATTVQSIISVWLSKKLLAGVSPVWGRLQLCLERLPTANFVSSSSRRADILELIKFLRLICGSFGIDSKHENRSALEPFVGPLVAVSCSVEETDIRLSGLSTLCDLCKVDKVKYIRLALDALSPYLRNVMDSCRLWACEVLCILIDAAGQDLSYFVRSLLPIVLSLLTDPIRQCAGLASKAFASIVRVAPLVPQQSSGETQLSTDCSFHDEVINHLILGKALPPTPLPEIVVNCLKSSNTVLRGYQKEGVTWLRFLQSVNLNGALCDSMGLGKTLQALLAIALSHMSLTEQDCFDTMAISLIICPGSVVGHFMQEIDRFFPGRQLFRPLCFVGTSSVRLKMWKTLPNDINLVITSYSVLRSDIELLASKEWRYCVLDEGHLLKNPKTATAQAARRLSSKHRLITTGTIIQNNINELWAAFDFLMPNFLDDQATFTAQYARPIIRGQLPGASATAISLSIEKLKTLHQQCLPFILRREKDEVLKELPPKIVSVLPVAMSASQRNMYEEIMNRQFAKRSFANLQRLLQGSSLAASDSCTSADAFKLLLLLRLVCTHPALIVGTKEGVTSLSSSGSDLELSGKIQALVQLLREAGIYEDNLSAADNDRSLLFCDSEDSSPGIDNPALDCFEVELSDRKATPGSTKCIIFAQFCRSLDVVEQLVLTRQMPGVKYLRLDGQVPIERRADIAKTFNCDPEIRVLLATTRVGGLGLNLTGADMVVFLENDLNPFVDMQAADRAHRLGQKNIVNVYNLVTSQSVEEKIMMLQQKKVAMSEAVVNTDNSTLYSMGTDRLLDIFDARAVIVNEQDASIDLDAITNQFLEEYKSLSVEGFLNSLDEQEPE